jgi:hypothetical protein
MAVVKTLAKETKKMPNTQAPAAVQPKPGDTYVHCGHVRPGDDFHAWIAPCQFVRPDGTLGLTQWLVCCEPCFQKAGGDGGKVQVRGDATWTGDEPPIVHPSARRPISAAEMRALDSMPGLTSALTTAAARFHTNNLVVLSANRPKQGRLIRRDLLAGKYPAEPWHWAGARVGFIVPLPTATRLLRTHCGAEGEYVASRLEERAALQECWTVTAGGNWVDACAYRQLKTTFFTSSDVRGQKQYAEEIRPG